jgi:hypothetical protein
MKLLSKKNWLKTLWCCLFMLFVNMNLALAINNKDDASPFYEHKHEIGINASQLLSNLLSLNVNNTPNTPFGIHYAYHQPKFTIRLGINALYKKQRDLGGFNNNNELLDHAFGARLSVEKNFNILPRLNLQAGIDGIVQNTHEESVITGQFLTSTNLLTLGGGPALRMIFKVNKHINIGTESTAYCTYGVQEKIVQLSTPTPDVKKSNFTGFNLTMPTALYISILF